MKPICQKPSLGQQIKLVPMQVKAWVRKAKLKFIKFGQHEKFGEIWLPKKISARTKRGKRRNRRQSFSSRTQTRSS